MRRLLMGSVLAAVAATAVAAVLAVGAIGGSGGGAEAAAEGIQVHGHWTIEVRDPDGTVAQRREFENALTTFGALATRNLLAGEASAGAWTVGLGRLSGAFFGNKPVFDNGPCTGLQGSPRPCLITEPDAAVIGGSDLHKNLEVTTTESPPRLQLRGTATATRADTISGVWTSMRSCVAAAAPSDCHAYFSGSGDTDFTRRSLGADAVAVEAGQQILVTVEVSFSSG